MAKIDRLGWAAGFAFSCYGVRVGVRASSPEVLDALAARLPRGWKRLRAHKVDYLYSVVVGGAGARPGVRRYHLLYAGAARLVRSFELEHVLERFESEVRLLVAGSAKRHVFVHAGVVGWRGRAIVVCGRSQSGKSTLVAELVRAGATYYSDEYAVFRGDGRVRPFAKPLSLRNAEGNSIPVPVETLGGEQGEAPLPVGLVVSATHVRGARWRPRRLRPTEAVFALLENAPGARTDPRRNLRILRAAVSHAIGLKGTRGEAAGVVPALLDRLERR